MAVDELIATIDERPGHEAGRALTLPTELIVAASAPLAGATHPALEALASAHTGLRDEPRSGRR